MFRKQTISVKQCELPFKTDITTMFKIELRVSINATVYLRLGRQRSVISIFKQCVEERSVGRVLLCRLKMRMMSHQVQ